MEIDLDHLMNMTGGDVDLADEVLDIFRNQSETWGRLLDPAGAQAEWADAAHALKGAALSIGATQFAEQCAEVERRGRDEPTLSRVEAATLLSSLKDGLGAALEACARASHVLSKPGLRRSKESNS
jgi:HPt (histidine-containing phosphotransfer) domain-containing protein